MIMEVEDMSVCASRVSVAHTNKQELNLRILLVLHARE